MSKITMPGIDHAPVGDMSLCRPYLAVEKEGQRLYTIIVGRDSTVLFFDAEDGCITHGTVEYLEDGFEIVRPYRTGETLTYIQG